MPSITRFVVRTTGRDLSAVHRPVRERAIAKAIVAPEPEDEAVAPALDTMLKADLVQLADSRGVDSSGTKADILARLGSVQ